MTNVNKEQVLKLLQQKKFEKLLNSSKNNRPFIKAVLSLMYDKEELICWRAVQALGMLSVELSENSLEKVRDLIRRLLWQMNDESGSIGWFAPQAIGEILSNVPVLIKEYGQIIISYANQPPFEEGIFWSIARLSSINASYFLNDKEMFLKALNSDNPQIKLFSLMILHDINHAQGQELLNKFKNDKTLVKLYNLRKSDLQTLPIGDIAQFMLAIP